MSIVVSVSITAEDGDTTLVTVGRAETVLPVTPARPGQEDERHDVDLVDLLRARVDAMLADCHARADEQIVDLRTLLENLPPE